MSLALAIQQLAPSVKPAAKGKPRKKMPSQFQIELAQATLTTWLAGDEREKQAIDARAKKNILSYLTKKGGRDNWKHIKDYFGFSQARTWHLLEELIREGEIIKTKPRWNVIDIEIKEK